MIGQVRMSGISKRFPGVVANKDVHFDVRSGEIHALLGENGAGKSTLMKQLYGMYKPDAGDIFVDDVAQNFHSPADAIAAGIGMIHQHLMLLPRLTVAENVALGLPSSRGPFLDLDHVTGQLCRLAEKYRLPVDPGAYVWQLSAGEQQRVEILKAIYRGAACLIMDEPTSLLTPQDVEEIFSILRGMAEAGHAIIFISHKLNEVLSISDRVTVLRDGEVVGRASTSEVSKESLAQMMVGRPVILEYDRHTRPPGEVILVIQDLTVAGARGENAVRELSLELRAGEIVGLAGVSGNGQRELAEAIAGLRPAGSGRILISGRDITNSSPRMRIKAGLAFISEDRMCFDVIAEFSVADNIILGGHDQAPLSKYAFLNRRAIESHSLDLIRTYEVRTAGLDTAVKHLSGGNIQKLVLARELSRRPQALVACQPTRGLDIGATQFVHNQLLAMSGDVGSEEQGASAPETAPATKTAILLISEDLDEIMALSDRIAVIYEGELVGIVDRDQATINELGLLMAGARSPHEVRPSPEAERPRQ